MSHGGLPMTASKPACGQAAAVSRRRTPPGIPAPNERTVSRDATTVGGGQQAIGGGCRQRAACRRGRQSVNAPNARAGTSFRSRTRRRTRRRRHASIARCAASRAVIAMNAPFLRAHLVERVVRRDSSEKRTGSALAQRRPHTVVSERQRRVIGPRTTERRCRRASQAHEPRAEQAVTGLQAVIEKAERPIRPQAWPATATAARAAPPSD